MRHNRWTAVAVVLIVGLAGAWWWKSRGGVEAPKFRTATVERGAIESLVSATGTVRPVVQVEVGSQVSGTVQRLHADYNSRVRAGQVLCQLDPSSFRARVAQADAAVARAAAALKDAQRQLARARELFTQNYVSQADVDAADVAVEQRDAELKQARAQLEAASVDLANTTIHAPIDGVVIARSVDLGQTVAASLQAPKLFVIANDLSQMQVETRIDEADIGVIHPDLPVRFNVDAFPDLSFRGRVAQVRLEPVVEQGVVTYTTVIRTENPELKLRPGMTANVSVLVARRDDALKVPNAALRFRPPADPGGRRAGTDGAARASGDDPGGEARAAAPARGRGQPGGGGASAATRDSSRDGGGWRGRRGGDPPADAIPADPDGLKPGSVYVLRNGRPVRVALRAGLSDGAFTEVRSQELGPGDRVVIGLENSTRDAGLQPPPGMGGRGFGSGGRQQGGRR